MADTATQNEQEQVEEAPSQDELLAIMSKHQSGYEKYCALRDEMKGASKTTKQELSAKQERHKKAFQAWKKAYNGLLKQGVTLRQIRKAEKEQAEAEVAATAPEPEAEPAEETS